MSVAHQRHMAKRRRWKLSVGRIGPKRVACTTMKLLYKPFDLIFKFVGRRLARSVFKQIWSAIDDHDPPKPTTQDASMGKIVGAQALEAGVSAGVGAAVDRAGVATFHYLIGGWPGDKTEAPED